METKRNQTAKDIAMLFADKINEGNIISDVFDYLEFDCTIRGYIDPNDMDEKIRTFYQSGDIDILVSIIDLIQKGKKAVLVDERKLFLDICQYIMDNLSHDITIEQIANEFNISYYYLCHFFKKKAKNPLGQFITLKRLIKACRLLLDSEDKISDIAMACGFDNFSYFSEVFLKHMGETPSAFRKKYADCVVHPFYEFHDILFTKQIPSVRFFGEQEPVKQDVAVPFVQVHNPEKEYGTFLHEAAIIEYKGVLYASWYNCKEIELVGYTPIAGRRSYDGGKTWTEPETIAEDKTGGILYCPPVYGICDGKLYMLMNQMVSADHMHALDLYVLNEETDRFEFLWSRPIPFKLNTNVVTLPNGKLILPGRIGELDGFPNTPAVMISDSGKIDAEWRLVKVAENGQLPDGSKLVHPETTLICCDNVLYMFSRDDQRKVPLVYISNDFGETWSGVMSHDIPYISSKIYSGELSDGRFYLVANVDEIHRSKLSLYISEKGKLQFTKEFVLLDCLKSDNGIFMCHYPSAVESDGKLYIIATADYKQEKLKGRGAIMFTVPLE